MFLPALVLATFSDAIAAEPSARPLAERIRTRLEASRDPTAAVVGDQRLLCRDALASFYERRAYRPAWFDGKVLSRNVNELVEVLGSATQHGLQPADYHFDLIRERVSRGIRPGEDVELDLMLSDAFLLYGSHLLSGQVNPETIDSEWFANRRGADMAGVLQEAIESGRVREALAELVPPQGGYHRLQEALSRYRQIASGGGWASIPEGPMLRPGMVDSRVPLIRERLRGSGDWSGDAAAEPEMLDEELGAAIKRFQRRHGLGADGVVGPATLAALNVPASRRVREIVINLERWRWLPQKLGSRYVLVNIADFRLDCVDKDETAFTSGVIVGRDYRRTPVFSDEISYIVFNPSWEVPHALAVEDILPQVRKDPAYLDRMGFEVLRGWGSDESRYDPASIDWAQVTRGSFPYRLRQKPGPLNALGRMKFMFPNPLSVYLHDTPARELFGKTERTFSSGCIRLEENERLAAWLLDGDPKLDERGISALLASGETRTVTLPRRVPIHLLYWTTWVDANGTIFFRRDIYGRDDRLDAALRQDPPAAHAVLPDGT